jgi:hypothetical protein
VKLVNPVAFHVPFHITAPVELKCTNHPLAAAICAARSKLPHPCTRIQSPAPLIVPPDGEAAVFGEPARTSTPDEAWSRSPVPVPLGAGA